MPSFGKKWILPLATLALLALTSCAAGSNAAESVPDGSGQVAGFWLGLWHGLILPITLIISLFRDSVSVYDIHNNGNFYDVGFLLGAMVILGGSGTGASKRR